jgi:hypothetical protein
LPNLLFTTAERFAARVTTHFVSVADAMTAQYCGWCRKTRSVHAHLQRL